MLRRNHPQRSFLSRTLQKPGKLYVVLDEGNQGKCRYTSRKRYQPNPGNLKTQNDWPVTWWRAVGNRQTIWAKKMRIVISTRWSLFQYYYGEIGGVKYYQILIPEQKVDKVLRSLHGAFWEQPRTTKSKIVSREKYQHPNMAQFIKECVMSCERCFRESRIDRRLICLPLQNPN